MSGITLAFTVMLLALASPVFGLRSEWNQEARDLILKIHNDYRRDEGGCQMNKLEYDMELETNARDWAERCVFDHKGFGENLAFDGDFTKRPKEEDKIRDSAKRWFDEKKFYIFGQNGCSTNGQACHYTQIVWHNTEKIGCWTTHCPSLRIPLFGSYKAWWIVCMYTPFGNINGQNPYKKNCDTPCKSGQKLEDGLCVMSSNSDSTGGSSNTSDGSSKDNCVDKYADCSMWARDNQCDTNPKWMKPNCKMSCKVCKSDKPAVKEVCEDRETDCKIWADNGDCSRNPRFMLKNCRKSCKVCKSDTPAAKKVCEDRETDCKAWADNGDCSRNPRFMLKNCRKSCKVCKSDTPAAKEVCEDRETDCKAWAKGDGCSRSPGYMLKHCKKSCKVCGGDTVEEVVGEKGNEGNARANDICEDKREGCDDWATKGDCNVEVQFMSERCKKSCGFCNDN